MIRYSLQCAHGHRFEAWFSSSADYDAQEASGLLCCAVCQTSKVEKAIMAPAVATGGRRDVRRGGREASAEAGDPAIPGNSASDFAELAARVRAHIRATSTDVGTDFARRARAMHEGAEPRRSIYGEATPREARELAKDGVPTVPLPAAFAPVPDKKLN